MGGRYVVTGMQLGMMLSMSESKDNGKNNLMLDGISYMIHQILDKQFIGESTNLIETDVVFFRNKLLDGR